MYSVRICSPAIAGQHLSIIRQVHGLCIGLTGRLMKKTDKKWGVKRHMWTPPEKVGVSWPPGPRGSAAPAGEQFCPDARPDATSDWSGSQWKANPGSLCENPSPYSRLPLILQRHSRAMYCICTLIRRLQLRFDGDSTALRPFDDLRYDRRLTCVWAAALRLK